MLAQASSTKPATALPCRGSTSRRHVRAGSVLGLVSLVWMERMVGVEFGRSRSQRIGKAVAEAQSGAGECTELEPGRYRARFVLGSDAAVYSGLARLLEQVRHWRATEV